MALTLKASMSNSQQTFEHERRRASQPDITLSVVKRARCHNREY